MKNNIVNINYISDVRGSKCSYCKKKKKNFSQGFVAEKITTSSYQELIDLGWRRCGNYYYNEFPEKSCCVYYTIKTNALNFIPKKNQKKVINTWNKFLNGEIDEEKNLLTTKNEKKNYILDENTKSKIDDLLNNLFMKFKEKYNINDNEFNKIKLYTKSQNNIYSNIFIIFKIFDKNYEINKNDWIENEYYNLIVENNYLKFNLKNKVKEFNNQKVDKKVELKKRSLNLKLVPADFTEEKFKMYEKYCIEIHKKKKVSIDSFKNFLCTRNLIENEIKKNDIVLKLGCYHLEYYLDNKLIGVGVVDSLLNGLSTVYFFYDPLYKKLKFGIFSVTKEIEYIKNMNKTFPFFKYYHLGYYIHDNIKMNYKLNYKPSFLLCYETFTYKEIDKDIIKKWDENKFSKFYENSENINKNLIKDYNEFKDFILNNMKMSIDNNVYIVKDILNFLSNTKFLDVLKNLRLGKEFIKNTIFTI